MKINLAAVLIRYITVMEKTECMVKTVASATKNCFLAGNHAKKRKCYDEHIERGDKKCS